MSNVSAMANVCFFVAVLRLGWVQSETKRKIHHLGHPTLKRHPQILFHLSFISAKAPTSAGGNSLSWQRDPHLSGLPSASGCLRLSTPTHLLFKRHVWCLDSLRSSRNTENSTAGGRTEGKPRGKHHLRTISKARLPRILQTAWI